MFLGLQEVRLNAQPKKILVVENDEVVVVLISHILTRHSYVVHTTLDALEADEMLQRDDYDAILLDLKMPNGGVELIRKLEERNPALLKKIIVVTGAMRDIPQLDGIPLCAVVKKPFEIAELVATVKSCADNE